MVVALAGANPSTRFHTCGWRMRLCASRWPASGAPRGRHTRHRRGRPFSGRSFFCTGLRRRRSAARRPPYVAPCSPRYTIKRPPPSEDFRRFFLYLSPPVSRRRPFALHRPRVGPAAAAASGTPPRRARRRAAAHWSWRGGFRCIRPRGRPGRRSAPRPALPGTPQPLVGGRVLLPPPPPPAPEPAREHTRAGGGGGGGCAVAATPPPGGVTRVQPRRRDWHGRP